MGKYRKKAITEAWQFKGKTTLENVKTFCKKNGFPKWSVGTYKGRTGVLIPANINNIKGVTVLKTNDYVVLDETGEYYACNGESFERNYKKI